MDPMDIDSVDPRHQLSTSYASAALQKGPSDYPNIPQISYQTAIPTPNIYRPLPSPPARVIRLLAISSPPPSPTNPLLRARLETYPIDSAPPYNAISYVWGTAGDSSSGGGQPEQPVIICNDALFPVTANLHWALHRAAAFAFFSFSSVSISSSPIPPSSSTESTYLNYTQNGLNNAETSATKTKTKTTIVHLWADAICINQASPAERSSQVAFMGAIYARARRVLVCMGPAPTPGAEVAVAALVNTVAPYLGALHKAVPDGVVVDIESGWRALAELMHRPWFSRVWVMQEVGMARGEGQPIVLYGTETGTMAVFGYRDLMRVVEWAKGRKELVVRYGIAGLRVHGEWLDWGQERGGKRGDSGGRRLTFFDLLDHGCLLSCRDPRDRVYAFLGHPLAQGPDGKPIVRPDYAKSVNELYLEVASKCLGMVGLRALVPLEHDEESLGDGFPSWMVRWHITGVWNNISQLPDKVFWAGGPDEPEYRPVGNGECLMLEGMVVDRILRCFPIYQSSDECCGVFDEAAEAGRSLVTWPRLLEFLSAESTPSAYERDENTRQRALGMTLCGARPGVDGARYLYGFSRLLALDYMLRSHFRAQPKQGDPAFVDALAYWKELTGACTGRSFALTERGRYCLVPRVSKAGDQVCVIRRLDVPVVMRVQGPRRLLLGESYVLGLMEGEAINMVQRGELTVEMFSIS